MENLGKKKWVIPAGNIPLVSTGKEPDLLSQDRISVLNTSEKPVIINMKIYYSNKQMVDNYKIKIQGKRLRKFRVNDLINPLPVDLKTDYSIVIEAEHEVIVQFLKMDTSGKNLSTMGTMAFGTDD